MKDRLKSNRPLKIIVTVMAVILILVAGLTVVSHAVYHRSNMATLSEAFLRISGTKSKFEDAEKCAAYIETRRNAEPYTLDVEVKSEVSEEMMNGSRIYTLDPSGTPDYILLYLHGGAYVNDANANYFRICDRLAQELNAEIIFPIYPLAPGHAWNETYALLEQLYRNRLANAEAPVIIMGDSAGGGLSVAFCEYLNEAGLPQPDKLILFSPWMDVSMSNPDAAHYEKADPMLSAYGLIEMGKCWANGLDLQDYRISPIFGDISCLNNVFLFVGTREIFYPDVTRFYEMLREQNSSAELFVGEGLNHVYPLYPIPEAEEALKQVCAIIQADQSAH